MPDRYGAVPAFSKVVEMGASAIILCAYCQCLFVRKAGIALAMPALLADSIILPRNYEDAIAGPYAKQWKGACEKESGALESSQVFDSETLCPAYRKQI